MEFCGETQNIKQSFSSKRRAVRYLATDFWDAFAESVWEITDPAKVLTLFCASCLK